MATLRAVNRNLEAKLEAKVSLEREDDPLVHEYHDKWIGAEERVQELEAALLKYSTDLEDCNERLEICGEKLEVEEGKAEAATAMQYRLEDQVQRLKFLLSDMDGPSR